jgi:single-strand DNA-binding protein
MAIARYTLAVDRRQSRNNSGEEQTADFINCVAFARTAEFAERYLHKGMKIAVTGRIQTGSYTNKDGVKVYTTEVVVEENEFCESKNASSQNDGGFGGGYGNNGGYAGGYSNSSAPAPSGAGDGFMNIPDGIDEELPFND